MLALLRALLLGRTILAARRTDVALQELQPSPSQYETLGPQVGQQLIVVDGDACPVGYSSLDEEDCEDAADTVAFKYNELVDWPSKPMGCYVGSVRRGRLHFNMHSSSAKRSRSWMKRWLRQRTRLVCKKGGDGPEFTESQSCSMTIENGSQWSEPTIWPFLKDCGVEVVSSIEAMSVSDVDGITRHVAFSPELPWETSVEDMNFPLTLTLVTKRMQITTTPRPSMRLRAVRQPWKGRVQVMETLKSASVIPLRIYRLQQGQLMRWSADGSAIIKFDNLLVPIKVGSADTVKLARAASLITQPDQVGERNVRLKVVTKGYSGNVEALDTFKASRMHLLPIQIYPETQGYVLGWNRDGSLTVKFDHIVIPVIVEKDDISKLGQRAGKRKLDRNLTLISLVHNPHWECSARDPGSCEAEHRLLFNGFLHKMDVDFAGLIMGGDYVAPEGYESRLTVSCRDRVELVWNKKRWLLEDIKGTEFKRSRAGVIARFKSLLRPGVTIVVATLHYPHCDWSKPCRGVNIVHKAIEQMKHLKTDNVLILADTNTPGNEIAKTDDAEDWKSSATLLNELGLSGNGSHSTQALPTCCADWENWRHMYPKLRPFGFSFDRIFSTFGQELETLADKEYLELTENYTITPWWAANVTKRWGNCVAAYHHPVMARITM